MAEVGDGWPLIRFLLDDAEYAALYRSYVELAVDDEYAESWAKSASRNANE